MDNKTFSVSNWMTEKYGCDIKGRILKLKEECDELFEVAERSEYLTNKDFILEFVDELADVNAVVYHIAHLIGQPQQVLLEKACQKMKERETNPNYGRKHEHVKKCRYCKEFSDENKYGVGFCQELKKTTYAKENCVKDEN